MSVIEQTRPIVQDFLAPKLREMRGQFERLSNLEEAKRRPPGGLSPRNQLRILRTKLQNYGRL
jgi:hypothetical protein